MSSAQAMRYKVFVSYAEADQAWVQGELLPALGLPSDRIITHKEFRLGATKVSEFARAVEESEYTLLILTPAYHASEWNRFTEDMASYAAVESGRNGVIPVDLAPGTVPLSIRVLTSLDCTKEENWEAEFSRLRELLSVPAPALARIPCPYPGMKPYSSDMAACFFGRDEESKALVETLKLQTFLILVGASGCGKSSLVFAGVVPRLDKDRWLIRSMRPGAAPIQELAAKLEIAAGGTDWAGAAEALLVREKRERLLLVIDQLEEALSLPPEVQDPFLSAIRSLQGARCAALMTMRADFFENLLRSKLGRIDQSEQMNLPPLSGEMLRAAITQPAENVKVYLESVLLQRLMTDAGNEPGVLPMLQETMNLLWEKMQRRLLTESAYRSLNPQGPGIAAALALRGQAAMSALNDPQRGIARRIVLRLINFGEGRADTRRQLPEGDLRSNGDDPADFKAALERLAENRILTLSGEETSAARVDLAHECLILGWPALNGWVKQYKNAENERRRLVTKTDEWVRLEHEGGWLDRVELDEAEKWIKGPDAAVLGVDPRLSDFAIASRRRIRRQRLSRVTLVAVPALGLLITGWWAYSSWLTHQAIELIQRPDVSSHRAALVKALWAVRLHDSIDTREALHQAVQTMIPDGRFRPNFDAIQIAFSPDGEKLAGLSTSEVLIVPESNRADTSLSEPRSGEFVSLAFRPSNGALAVGSKEGKLIVWKDASPGASEVLDDHSQAVTCVAYSLQGNLLATGSEDKTILVRDADTLKVKAGPLKAMGRINQVAFSPDGKYLAAATSESSGVEQATGDPLFVAKLWAVDTGAWVRDFGGHKGAVTGIAFDPNGKRMVTSSQDGRLRIWDWQDRNANGPIKELTHEHDAKFGGDEQFWMAQNAFSAVAFDQDGHLASATSGQGFAEIWDASSGKRVDLLRGHHGTIRAIAYSSAHGRHKLATAGNDKTVRIYYLDKADLIARAQQLRDSTPGVPAEASR